MGWRMIKLAQRAADGAHEATGQHSQVPALRLAKPWQCHCARNPCAGELPPCDGPLVCSGSQQPGQGWTLITCKKKTDPSPLSFPQRTLSSPPTNSCSQLLWGRLLCLQRSLCTAPAASWLCTEGTGTGEQLQQALCHCSWPQAKVQWSRTRPEHTRPLQKSPCSEPCAVTTVRCRPFSLPVTPTPRYFPSLLQNLTYLSSPSLPVHSSCGRCLITPSICPDAHLQTFSFLSGGDQHVR